MHKLDEEVKDILKHWGVKGMKWDEKLKKEEDEAEKKKKAAEKKSANAKLVDEIIRGKYGNGEVRKKKLGKKYRELQDLVNEKLLGKPAKKSKDKSKTKTKSKSKSKSKSKKTSKKKEAVKHIKSKLKTKNSSRSSDYIQNLKLKTIEEIDALFSKFTN